MSLSLDLGSYPDGTCASSRDGYMAFDDGGIMNVFLSISNADWCQLVSCQLTNSDLVENDPRLPLLKLLRAEFDLVDGYNAGARRIQLKKGRK